MLPREKLTVFFTLPVLTGILFFVSAINTKISLLRFCPHSKGIKLVKNGWFNYVDLLVDFLNLPQATNKVSTNKIIVTKGGSLCDI